MLPAEMQPPVQKNQLSTAPTPSSSFLQARPMIHGSTYQEAVNHQARLIQTAVQLLTKHIHKAACVLTQYKSQKEAVETLNPSLLLLPADFLPSSRSPGSSPFELGEQHSVMGGLQRAGEAYSTCRARAQCHTNKTSCSAVSLALSQPCLHLGPGLQIQSLPLAPSLLNTDFLFAKIFLNLSKVYLQ